MIGFAKCCRFPSRRVKTAITSRGHTSKNTKDGKVESLAFNCYFLLIHIQESPHEHQQNLLLSRIITNVV
jgi:hypothetical protein